MKIVRDETIVPRFLYALDKNGLAFHVGPLGQVHVKANSEPYVRAGDEDIKIVRPNPYSCHMPLSIYVVAVPF